MQENVFDSTAKWYIHKLESVRVNEMDKILWDFEIQADQLIQARRPQHVIINKQKRNKPVV